MRSRGSWLVASDIMILLHYRSVSRPRARIGGLLIVRIEVCWLRPPSFSIGLNLQLSPVPQPAEEVYAGQVIGLHNKAGSMFAVCFRIIAFPLVVDFWGGFGDSRMPSFRSLFRIWKSVRRRLTNLMCLLRHLASEMHFCRFIVRTLTWPSTSRRLTLRDTPGYGSC